MANYFYIFFIGLIAFIFILMGIRLVKEYQRVVVFRLGRFNGTKGPGLFWVVPFFDKTVLVDLRTQVIEVPRQEAITKDNVPTIVNAAIFYAITDPAKAIIRVENVHFAVAQIAQTTLRSVIGAVDLDELLSHREKVNAQILDHIEEISDAWGIDCSRVALKDLEVPDNMKRAMAKQAESERERRSRVILAEGELEASEKLSKAAAMMGESGGVQLRLLQTLQEISAENSSTVIIPFPADLTGTVAKIVQKANPQISVSAKKEFEDVDVDKLKNLEFDEDEEPAKPKSKSKAKN